MSWVRHVFKSQKYIYSIPIVMGVICSASLSGLNFSISRDVISIHEKLNETKVLFIAFLILLWCSSFLWVYINKFYITKWRAFYPFAFSLVFLSIVYVFTHFLFSLASVNLSTVLLNKGGLSEFLARIFIDGLSSMGAFLTVPVLWKSPSDDVRSLRKARARIIGLLSKIKDGEELPQDGERKILEDLQLIAEAGEELRHFLASDQDKCLLRKWKNAAEEHWRVLDGGGPEGEVIKYFSKAKRSKTLSEILKT
jgi:hypothetical protein